MVDLMVFPIDAAAAGAGACLETGLLSGATT